jgi:hypothetical protein
LDAIAPLHQGVFIGANLPIATDVAPVDQLLQPTAGELGNPVGQPAIKPLELA